MGATHRLLGAAAGVVWAGSQHLGPGQTVVGVAVAVLTSAGGTSPDVDQSWAWRRTGRVLPARAFGHGGPMRHRGLSHWWGLPAGAALWLAAAAPGWYWVAAAALVGWGSHLLGDLVFGRHDVRSARGPGIPLAPWWGHVGLGLDVGGTLERLVMQRLALPLALAWLTLDHLGLAHPLWQRVSQAVVSARHG